MTYAVPRALVDAFYKAYASHDTDRLLALLDDDISWIISGPVDVLSFCGTRRGKPAVLDLVDRIVPSIYRVVSLVQDSVLVEGDRAATLNRMAGRRCDDGRVINYRLAHFLRFRDGKLIENVSIIDSFDAVEQMIGHPLALQDYHKQDGCMADTGDLVAV